MLNGCGNLNDCEKVLSAAIGDAELISDLGLTDADLDLLTRLVREEVSDGMSRGSRVLIRQTPTCLATFLVWQGINGYSEGNYWTAVEEVVGPLDANWQVRWGRFFIDFLEEKNLPTFQIPGSLAYVTPILSHGGIPNSCMPEFFDRVLRPLVYRELLEPTDAEEISYLLQIAREDEVERADIGGQIEDVRARLRDIQRQADLTSRAAETYDDILELWRLESTSSSKARHGPEGLPEDPAKYLEEKRTTLAELTRSIEALEQRRADAESVMASFTQEDRRLLKSADQIEHFGSALDGVNQMEEEYTKVRTAAAQSLSQLQHVWGPVSAASYAIEFGEQIGGLELDRLLAELGSLESLLASRAEEKATHRAAAERKWLPSIPSLLLQVGIGIIGIFALVIGMFPPPWPLLILIGLAALTAYVVRLALLLRKMNAPMKQTKQTEENLLAQELEIQRALDACRDSLDGIPISEELLVERPTEIYPVLCALRDMHTVAADEGRRAITLEKQIASYTDELERLAEDYGFAADSSYASLTNTLLAALERADRADKESEMAESSLEDEILPKLETLREARAALIAEIADVEARLTDLGDGDIQMGISLASESGRVLTSPAQARKLLEDRFDDVSTLEDLVQETNRHKDGKAYLIRQRAQLNRQASETQLAHSTIEDKLPAYPAAYPGIDEPIRRYLLYGGKHSESFLVNSCKLMSDWEPGEHGVSVQLSDRVIARFQEWREATVERGLELPEREIKAGAQRLSGPIISISPARREVTVMLRPQRLSEWIPEAQVSLEVTGDGDRDEGLQFDLRRYGVAKDVVETQEQEFPLPFPSHSYRFDLKGPAGDIKTWNARTNGHFYTFRYGSGRIITDDLIPKEKVWLVLSRDYSIRPVSLVIANHGELHGKWSAFSLLELDLSEAEELVLHNRLTKRSAVYPLVYGEPPEVGFVGGNLLQGATSDAGGVFIGSPPNIRIPIASDVELRFWRLSLIPLDAQIEKSTRRHFRVSDLGEAILLNLEAGSGEIQMSHDLLLGPQPFGRYQVRIHRSPYSDWLQTLTVVPDLDYAFDETMYLPYRTGEAPSIGMSVSTSEGIEFIAAPPAEVIGLLNGRVNVSSDAAASFVQGMLRSSQKGQETSIPISFEIPKVWWRFQGLVETEQDVWSDNIREVWIGEESEEKSLILKLPSVVEGQSLSLGIGGASEKKAESTVSGGNAQFGLLAFSDAFKHSAPRQSLWLSTASQESLITLEDELITEVITRWQSDEIQCVQIVEGRSLILEVSWAELGKALSKELSLWRVQSTSSDPIAKRAVGADALSARLVVDSRDAPPGRYLLQLASADPWASTAATRPQIGDPNTAEIRIVTAGDLRRGQTCMIGTVEDLKGRPHKLEVRYTIIVLGKIVNRQLPSAAAKEKGVLVTKTNEGWYVGRMSVDVFEEDKFESQIDEANPVKLEYEVAADCITSVEDKYGEGAMFCENCRRLYWSFEALQDEERRNHKLLGPIEMFRITWTEGPMSSKSSVQTAVQNVLEL